ncbi:hypothetical protein CesoFtcFv8_022747 [Champsocephalus esox]|uniref:Uncharacterized protein n=1 Tax=Champsocephalus esox TaxID=159716 RepID=A0AAN8B6U1_9TELE|nr:hypothetical protein CesoFtcFv8_022747 [Champsocephalus esox]
MNTPRTLYYPHALCRKRDKPDSQKKTRILGEKQHVGKRPQSDREPLARPLTPRALMAASQRLGAQTDSRPADLLALFGFQALNALIISVWPIWRHGKGALITH